MAKAFYILGTLTCKEPKPSSFERSSSRKSAQPAAIGLGPLLSNYEISPRIVTGSELLSLIYAQPKFKGDLLGGGWDSGFAKLGSRYRDAMQAAIDYARDRNHSSKTPNLARVVSMLNDMFSPSSGICPYIRAMKEGSLQSLSQNDNNPGPQPWISRKILGSLQAIDSSIDGYE
ncbi:hypothetical protein V1525DRAFT_64224 [Lipomyces kononenkoae]|uniref:Uncharacterized protein n=1 Tax=Lipomyces kononenkoae TaxID=34357 RepID=A0ACC3T5T3_LIPKO